MAEIVTLKYVSNEPTGNTYKEYEFQARPLVRTKAANFHTYRWNPRIFNYQYGAAVLGIGKEPLTYATELYLLGSVAERKAWLSDFHFSCDYDITMNTPGRLYWGDMYIECYATYMSTAPNRDEIGTTNTIEFFCPYPSWVYDATYEGELSVLVFPGGMKWLPSDYTLEIEPYETRSGDYGLLCDFEYRITSYGPEKGPSAMFKNVPHNNSAYRNPRLVIDSRRKTVRLREQEYFGGYVYSDALQYL